MTRSLLGRQKGQYLFAQVECLLAHAHLLLVLLVHLLILCRVLLLAVFIMLVHLLVHTVESLSQCSLDLAAFLLDLIRLTLLFQEN